MKEMSVEEYSKLIGVSESTVKSHLRNDKLNGRQEKNKWIVYADDAVKSVKRIIPKQEKDLKKKITELRKEIKYLKLLAPDNKEWYIEKLEKENQEMKDKLEMKEAEIRELNKESKEDLKQMIGQTYLLTNKSNA